MLTFFPPSYSHALITSWPELPRSELYPSNPPVSPDEQCPSNIHLQTDWYPSVICLPNHLLQFTIHQASLISFTSVHILLTIATASQGIPRTKLTIADVIHYLYA